MSQAEDRANGQSIGVWGRLLLFAAVAAAAVAFLGAIGTLVKLLLISALLAYVMDPAVVFFEARGLGRITATSIVFLALLLVMFMAFRLLIPALSVEISALKTIISTGKANTLIDQTQTLVNDKLAKVGAEKIDLHEMWHSFVVEDVNQLLGYVLNVVSFLTSFLLIPFVTFFLLIDGRRFRKEFVSIVPNRYFEFTLNLLYKMDVLLGRYLRGVFLEALIIGALATMILWLMHVKYYVVLGIVIGLTNIIPYFGPLVGAIPAILIALIDTGSFSFALYVSLGLVSVQIIDNAAVKPVLLSRMVDIRPLTVLLVVLIGGKFFGVFGMLLSVPAAAILKVGITETVRNFRQYFRTHFPSAAAEREPLLVPEKGL